MNIKTVVKTVIFFTALIFFSVSGQSSDRQVINKPKNVVIAFYTEYLSALNDPDTESGLTKSQNAIDKYTNKNLRKLQDENDSGADYFLSAQEACPDWLNHITVHQEKIKNNIAELELNLGVGNSLSVYDVHMVMENSHWLMDSVEFKSRKTEGCYQD